MKADLMRFRTLFAILGVLMIVAFTFFAATRVTKVDRNTERILTSCRERNEQLAKVNDKFNDLILLFDASQKARAATQPPPTPEVLALYEKFKEPIEISDCDGDSVPDL